MKLSQRLHRLSPARRARLRSIRLFSHLSPDELRHVDRLGRETALPAGHVLIRQGDASRDFFVILKGAASVWRDGVLVARLGPGDYCGELALLTDASRDATVVAAQPVEALVFDDGAFGELLAAVPELTHELLQRTVRRLRRAESAAALGEPVAASA